MSIPFNLQGYALRAVSLGGWETCIALPGLDLCFDIGRCPRFAVGLSTVLITHAHMDHIGGLPFHAATRGMRGLAPPVYLLPQESIEGARGLFEAWRRLEGSRLTHSMIPMAPGQRHLLPCGLEARSFRSPHRLPCLGYGLWRSVKKLRPEFLGREQQELASLARSGVSLTQTIERPEIVFTGDCTLDVLYSEPSVREARLLIMELTFLDQAVTVREARKTGHVHLDEVVDAAEDFTAERILFTHFSARYRRQEILETLTARLPLSLRRRAWALVDGEAVSLAPETDVAGLRAPSASSARGA